MFKTHHWGEVAYNLSVVRQKDLLHKLASSSEKDSSNAAREQLIFCSHPPLVTLGRSSSPSDVTGWKGPIFQSQRGGRATYHGPSQIVVYSIMDLRRGRAAFRPRDIHDYLRSLECWLAHSLKEFSIEVQLGSCMSKNKFQGNTMTGLWVGEKKIASIGIAIKSWISYHGIALNLMTEKDGFRGIRPCGFESHVMTSMEEVLGKKLKRESVEEVLESQFKRHFQRPFPKGFDRKELSPLGLRNCK